MASVVYPTQTNKLLINPKNKSQELTVEIAGQLSPH